MNPYQRLKDEHNDMVRAVITAETISMWTYDKVKLGQEWNLSALYQRVSAAHQLDFDVLLRATDEGLKVVYRKRVPLRYL